MITGERIFGAIMGLVGVLWAVLSLDLTYMGDYAPGSGFLPFWCGVSLAALSVLFLVISYRRDKKTGADAQTDSQAVEPPIGARGKALSVFVGLCVCVGLIEVAGFAIAVFAYQAFVIRVIERRSWFAATGVAFTSTLILYLVFKVWLAVPLPTGFAGF